MKMTFTDDDLDRLSDRLAEVVHAKLPDWRPLVSDPENGEILGIDPHALYSVKFLAERWEVSTDTIYRWGDEQLPRADWQGSRVRYRGIDILRYEGVDLDNEASATQDDGAPQTDAVPQAEETNREPDRAPESGTTESNYSGKLPKL